MKAHLKTDGPKTELISDVLTSLCSFCFRLGAPYSRKANWIIDRLLKASLDRFRQFENDRFDDAGDHGVMMMTSTPELLRCFRVILEVVESMDTKKREKVSGEVAKELA